MRPAIRSWRTAWVGVTHHVEALGTSCPSFIRLTSIGRKLLLVAPMEKHYKILPTSSAGPQPASTFVMLVESDVRGGIRGILP
jgi:hypothetical protein